VEALGSDETQRPETGRGGSCGGTVIPYHQLMGLREHGKYVFRSYLSKAVSISLGTLVKFSATSGIARPVNVSYSIQQ